MIGIKQKPYKRRQKIFYTYYVIHTISKMARICWFTTKSPIEIYNYLKCFYGRIIFHNILFCWIPLVHWKILRIPSIWSYISLTSVSNSKSVSLYPCDLCEPLNTRSSNNYLTIHNNVNHPRRDDNIFNKFGQLWFCQLLKRKHTYNISSFLFSYIRQTRKQIDFFQI